LINEIIWPLTVFIDLFVALLLFKLFKKEGLYLVIVANIIVCNIQVLKTVSLFGLTTTLGNVLYGSIYLTTDLLSETYGKKEANKGVWLGFTALLMMTIYMQLSLLLTPHPDDFASPHLEALFSLMPRVAAGSLTAYVSSQFLDVWMFHRWKNITGERLLWWRNNFSTTISQAVDTLLFCLIAFYGLYPVRVWWEIVFTTFLYKFIVALCDTPFVYFGRKIGKNLKMGYKENAG
jgi:uncharacterized integral membrane protein (TIGR00697 family)